MSGGDENDGANEHDRLVPIRACCNRVFETISRSRFATRVHSPPDITRRNHRSASEHIGRGYTLESRILLEVIERKGNRYLVRAKICLALIGFHKRSKIIVFERYSILIVCEFTSSGYNEILIKNVDRLFVKI